MSTTRKMSPRPAAPETNANDSFRWYSRQWSDKAPRLRFYPRLLVQQNQVEVIEIATFLAYPFDQKDQMVKISHAFLQHLIDTVCYTH